MNRPRRLGRRAAAVMAALIGVAVSFSTALAAEWSSDELFELLADIDGFEATFDEMRTSVYLDQPLKLSGRLVYVAPDRLEKHTLEPEKERLVISRSLISIESGDGRDRTSRTVALAAHPELGSIVESLRATLSGQKGRLEENFTLQLDGKRGDWQLSLLPLARNDKLNELVELIRISGQAARITRLEIREPDGGNTLMTIDYAGNG